MQTFFAPQRINAELIQPSSTDVIFINPAPVYITTRREASMTVITLHDGLKYGHN